MDNLELIQIENKIKKALKVAIAHEDEEIEQILFDILKDVNVWLRASHE